LLADYINFHLDFGGLGISEANPAP